VPEKQYLEYMDEQAQRKPNPRVELLLANDKRFPQPGKITTIKADFNRETGNVAFRADFPNPDRLLRHGQTGTVLINQVLDDAIVIPQKATLEVRDKRYVYVVDKQSIAHRREITIRNELDDLFVVEKGVSAGDKIVLEGIRLIHDGDKVKN